MNNVFSKQLIIEIENGRKLAKVPLAKLVNMVGPPTPVASPDDAKKIAQRLAAGNEFPLAASRSAPMIFTSEEIAR